MSLQSVLGNVLDKLFGSRNERVLKKFRFVADEVEALEDEVRALSDEELLGQTEALAQRAKDGESVETLLASAFAVVREASRRAKEHRHFHCQLIGGKVLFDGTVAEMRTGEGKSIVCHLAAYLRVVMGQKVHIVTVNDYLVKRDAEFAAVVFERLGVTVGFIQSQVDPGGQEGIRRDAYACNITYGTTSEFGFDYLRDNMKIRHAAQVQGRLDYAIVDEVDSTLIDEARTPLIISGPAVDDPNRYKWADNLARLLVRKQAEFNKETKAQLAEWGDNLPDVVQQNPKAVEAVKRFAIDPNMVGEEEAEGMGHRQCFVVQQDRKSVALTHDGVAVAQDEAGIGSFYVGENMDRPHLIEQALRAHLVYERDKEYVVQDREVIIVDENTGRLMIGRQWSDGLHQAVEAKENVPIKQETQTLATITIQNFFKLYKHLAGMTGTAATESEEFLKIYKLDVVQIPTNRPVNRVNHNDKMYRNVDQKYNAIVDEIHEMRRRGRPRDPFLMFDLFKSLKPILARMGQDTSKIDEAIAQFNSAEEGDQKVINFMLETYDDAMGDLAMGRPVLVGTTSVENSEKISSLLSKRYGIEHEVLNAKNHSREAEIVTKAGHRQLPTRGSDKSPIGNVTIATNMAGRGTDIKLEQGVVYETCKVSEVERANELYPIGSSKCCIHCEEYDPATNCAHCYKPKLDPRFPDLGRKVCSLNAPCGLHIIGTERHEARRIDNQLRGRAGRQGDPGSSRFFISLEDDLIKLFMPDWMLKMMEKLGFSEGTSLEDKRLTRGIERAQRKVEERNFSSRKHLLEWDEPMDFQRKDFYSKRQHVLADPDVARVIFDMIDESIEESVADFLGAGYRAHCISNWVRSHLEVVVSADDINVDDLELAQERIRKVSIDEAREVIRTSLVEYIDPDEDASTWDVGGLIRWAQRAYKFSFTQNQLKKMDPRDIEDALTEAAEQFYGEVDLSGIEAFASGDYGSLQLAEWARSKFEIGLDSGELEDLPASDVADLVRERVRATYREREVRFPVEQAMAQAFGSADSDNAQACEVVCRWAKVKYNADWSVDNLQDKPIEEITEQLIALQTSFLYGGKLESEIEKAMADHEGDDLIEWARARFQRAFYPMHEQALREKDDPKETLVEIGRLMLRFELTQLERYILLRIYDQSWKDHLWEMDRLKTAIMQRPMGGDQTHPQSQYAIEGREFFNQMWTLVRSRVTDIVFKLRAGGGGTTVTTGAAAPVNYQHADASGNAFAQASRDEQSAMQAQNAPRKTETIRRADPKVGRNDPCPCGSGRKYKQCHGKK